MLLFVSLLVNLPFFLSRFLPPGRGRFLSVLVRHRGIFILCGFLAAASILAIDPLALYATSHQPCDGAGVNTEACICQGLDVALVPSRTDAYGEAMDGFIVAGNESSVGRGRPFENPETGLWSPSPSPGDDDVAPWGTSLDETHSHIPHHPPHGGRAVPTEHLIIHDYDLVYIANDRYKEHCSLSYLQENMLRLWRFSVVLGGIFATISITMVGVVYMQESASGQDLSKVKGYLFRVIAGLILLAMALVVWQFLNEYVITHIDGWTWQQLRSG